MKIVLVSQTYGPANGAGAFVAALARGLAARGDDVTVIAPADRLRSGCRGDGLVVVAALRACSLAPLYPEVRVPLAPARPVERLLDALAPDVVHIQDHFPLGRCAARASAARGVPLVATNHFVPETIAPHVPLVARTRVLERVLWRMVARVFEQAAVVTTPTQTAVALLRPWLPGVPLRAISCGVELARFARAGERATIRRAMGFARGDRVFVYVGRLDLEKRVEVLVRALAVVGRPDLKLLIVGRGRQDASLRRLAHRLGVAGQVVFAGFVPPERVAELLAGADYFAMPGDVELQSIATLEAMAAGLPVLAARAGALPELVEDGVNGALFRANDAAAAAAGMRELVAAADHGSAMSQASRLRAARHDVRYTVDAYRALYAEVAAGG